MSTTRRIRITIAGQIYDVTAELLDENVGHAQAAPMPQTAPVMPASRQDTARPQPGTEDGQVLCPISGIVVTIHVKQGQQVTKGDILVTIEAMKMSTPVWAPQDGVVASIHTQTGVRVQEGAVLIKLT